VELPDSIEAPDTREIVALSGFTFRSSVTHQEGWQWAIEWRVHGHDWTPFKVAEQYEPTPGDAVAAGDEVITGAAKDAAAREQGHALAAKHFNSIQFRLIERLSQMRPTEVDPGQLSEKGSHIIYEIVSGRIGAGW